MLLNRELSYQEFKGFYECIEKTITEKEFKTEILGKYCSTHEGLTSRGFEDWFKDQIKNLGEVQNLN